MSYRWFALESMEVDFVMAWFVATKKGRGYDLDRPFVGAVVYDYHHRHDRSLVLTEYNSVKRKFKKLTIDRFEDNHSGDGSKKRPFGYGMFGSKAKREISAYLKNRYSKVFWIDLKKSGADEYFKRVNK